jgi:hypothetical protein
MLTWAVVMRKLDWFLGDAIEAGETDADRTFPEILRIESWNWAQRFFCAHTPLARQTPLRIEEGGREALLPPDFYKVEGLYDADEERWWWPMRRRPGDVRPADDDVLEFWIRGNRMFLETELDYYNNDMTLYYWAYYPDVEYVEVENEQDGGSMYVTPDVRKEEILIPAWAESALCHLTASFVHQPGSITAADINQWDIKIDSGTPLMNPRAEQAKLHLWWYDTIINRHPPAVRQIQER